MQSNVFPNLLYNKSKQNQKINIEKLGYELDINITKNKEKVIYIAKNRVIYIMQERKYQYHQKTNGKNLNFFIKR